MMFNRARIGLRAPEARYRLDRHLVQGMALHWPGSSTRYSNPAEVMAALRAFQRLHMDTDQIAKGGASDIAYQVAVDQAGHVYQLRGLRHRSGANGDQDVNERFGAMLLMLGIGEKPTPAMIQTVQRRIARFQHIYPGATQVVGHQAIRPGGTACPGPAVLAGIRAHVFDPPKGSQ